MGKVVRNTIFTVLALVLASIGVEWNHNIATNRQPLSAEQAVLASQATSGDYQEQTFPLAITFAAPAVKLGQSQEIRIHTVPEASIELVTTYPNGDFNNPQTLRVMADSRGEYRLKFKLNDFHDLGLFTVSAIATSGNKTAEASNHFVLQSWAPERPANGDYTYPLVP